MPNRKLRDHHDCISDYATFPDPKIYMCTQMVLQKFRGTNSFTWRLFNCRRVKQCIIKEWKLSLKSWYPGLRNYLLGQDAELLVVTVVYTMLETVIYSDMHLNLIQIDRRKIFFHLPGVNWCVKLAWGSFHAFPNLSTARNINKPSPECQSHSTFTGMADMWNGKCHSAAGRDVLFPNWGYCFHSLL